jgi:hypothetical protein
LLTDGSNPLSNFHLIFVGVAAYGVGMAKKGFFETAITARYTNSIIAFSDFKKKRWGSVISRLTRPVTTRSFSNSQENKEGAEDETNNRDRGEVHELV